MTSVLDAPWFFWAVGVAIGLPICLVVLTELQNALRRRGSALARPGSPGAQLHPAARRAAAAAVKANEVSGEATPVRIVATVFGFVVLVLLLSGLNATLFQGAPEGSWRKRIPSIFLDVARFASSRSASALIFSYIWGANVGGLFTALGVSSIVLGLTLQNSVGQIISGLLVLFEQPFQLGDWIDTPSARGRVVEVNWRATHIDTGSGLLIMPELGAGRRVVHQLQPAARRPLDQRDHRVRSSTIRPTTSCAMLNRVAGTLPHLRADAAPSSVHAGGCSTSTSIPLRTPADDFAREIDVPAMGLVRRRGGPNCISTRPRTTSRLPSGSRSRCASSRRRCG